MDTGIHEAARSEVCAQAASLCGPYPAITSLMALGGLLALDLEFGTAGFQCGALVGDGQEYLFGREDISDVGHILNLAAVVGHNIRRFDLPKFSELLGVPLDISENRLLDTLELASLLWPG